MKYTSYQTPCAGWQGYITNTAGKVESWVAIDGTVVPDSSIAY